MTEEPDLPRFAPARPPANARRRRTAGPARPLTATGDRASASSDRAPEQAPAQPAPGAARPPRRAGGQPRVYPNPPGGGSPARRPGAPATAPAPGPARPGDGAIPAKAKRRRGGRKILIACVLVLLAALAWPTGLAIWANGKLQHVEALAPGGAEDGRTYLVAGSDQRGSGGVNDPTEGARTDSLILVHVAANGQAYLVSLPRDTYVEIPGHGGQKINAAYAFGGPKLLVETVQSLTGMHIKHYVEVGFGSVTELVDAVDGVNLCLDRDVSDRDSKLEWKAGCHDANGAQALAFARMRKADPLGDIGRGERQRQVLGAVMHKAIEPALLLQPGRQVDLVKAGTTALTVDEDATIFSLGRLMLDLRAATGPEGIQGTPAIKTMNYQPGGIGQAVLLDPEEAARDFEEIRDGTWTGRTKLP